MRRALLLFAIVLGLAAVAASLAPPPDAGREGERQRPSPRAEPSRPDAPAAEAAVAFDAGARRPARRRVAVGEHVTVTVGVRAAGQVEIRDLGLLQFAAPGTPATFDVVATRPGRYEVTFAGTNGAARRVGVLEVVAPVS